ncbi:enoyl-CoA hydratase/isomerase family protein [Noviherbaspirillum suwonense]|uniref:Enoyl-CoA hydratase/isomerase n=1 Tax=Noviherbaspirillum suwonense TaxID=1224511 RepID=A0ABY1QVJ8_9BURK|nr:enoyl-CoA hydratase/isomerase family protein [Noviherbaspirillum suwonense]SMP79017.1 Enoyl-CoA hydratase/isomerase [Noviherbaspirillum suwonense]
MSEAETVLNEVHDGIATVKINRPEMRNALSSVAANRLHDLWGEVDADKNVRVAILTLADCGTFCAGLDLREALRVKKEEGVDIVTKMKDPFHGRQCRVAKPIIAAMTGHLIAGGMMLSLNSDLPVGLKGTQAGIAETRIAGRGSP